MIISFVESEAITGVAYVVIDPVADGAVVLDADNVVVTVVVVVVVAAVVVVVVATVVVVVFK